MSSLDCHLASRARVSMFGRIADGFGHGQDQGFPLGGRPARSVKPMPDRVVQRCGLAANPVVERRYHAIPKTPLAPGGNL